MILAVLAQYSLSLTRLLLVSLIIVTILGALLHFLAHLSHEVRLSLTRELHFAFAGFEVLTTALACDREAGNLWLIIKTGRRQDHYSLVLLQKHMHQRGSEKGTIQVELAQRNVDLLALGAVHFDPALSKFVLHSKRQYGLLITQCSLAVAIGHLQVITIDDCQSFSRPQIASMQEPIQVTRILIQLQEYLVLQVLARRTMICQDQLQTITEVIFGYRSKIQMGRVFQEIRCVGRILNECPVNSCQKLVVFK